MNITEIYLINWPKLIKKADKERNAKRFARMLKIFEQSGIEFTSVVPEPEEVIIYEPDRQI